MFRYSADSSLNHQENRYIWDNFAPCVCRIQTPGVYGTGFIIGALKEKPSSPTSHRFLFTCYHIGVKEAVESKKNCTAQFGYLESGREAMVTVPIIPCVFAFDKNLDYIVLALQSTSEFEDYLTKNLHIDLGRMITNNKPSVNDPLAILGHRYGNELRLDLAHSVDRPADALRSIEFIFYQCSSFDGTSGAPVFSRNKQELYAIHRGGSWQVDPSFADPTNSVEHGVFLWDVLRHIKDNFLQQADASPSDQPRISIDGFSQLFTQFTG